MSKSLVAQRRDRSLLVCMAIALIASIGLWRLSTRGSHEFIWVDEQEGDGAVLALASGRAPGGPEFVVAGGYYRKDGSGRDLCIVSLRSEDGKRLWEERYDRALPNMSKSPLLAVDTTGDVFVGWDYWAVGSGSHPVIEKLAGSDGRPLWRWTTLSGGNQSGLVAEPVPDKQGRIWISGIRKISGDQYQRFIALLTSSDGSSIWNVSVNEAEDANDRRASIHPLEGGDAAVIAAPRSGERSFPWLIQRFVATDGRVIWERRVLRENERGLPILRWIVDEENRQIVVFWSTVSRGRMEIEVVSFDLTDGKERWRSSESFAGMYNGGLTEMTLGGSNTIQLWGRHADEEVITRWWRWHYEEGMWFPEREVIRFERPLCVTISGVNGKIQSKDWLGRRDERINAVLPGPSKRNGIALILRDMEGHKKVAPWRTLWQNDTVEAGTGKRPQPRGEGSTLHFPRHVILTAHGRIVIAVSEDEDTRKWQITVW